MLLSVCVAIAFREANPGPQMCQSHRASSSCIACQCGVLVGCRTCAAPTGSLWNTKRGRCVCLLTPPPLRCATDLRGLGPHAVHQGGRPGGQALQCAGAPLTGLALHPAHEPLHVQRPPRAPVPAYPTTCAHRSPKHPHAACCHLTDTLRLHTASDDSDASLRASHNPLACAIPQAPPQHALLLRY
jgi:hypothetical protein